MDLFNLILSAFNKHNIKPNDSIKDHLGSDFEKVANDIIESIKYRKQEKQNK
jgi:hypothetical protein